MQPEIFAYILLALVVGAAVTFFLCKSRMDELCLQLSEVKTQLVERTTAHERELEYTQKNALTVVTYPYKEEHGEDGFFSDQRRAEVGYMYHVFVAGVPCFEPHKVAVDVFSKKEVNPAKIEHAMQQTFALVESFASKHPAFVAFQSAPAALEGVRKALTKSRA